MPVLPSYRNHSIDLHSKSTWQNWHLMGKIIRAQAYFSMKTDNFLKMINGDR